MSNIVWQRISELKSIAGKHNLFSSSDDIAIQGRLQTVLVSMYSHAKYLVYLTLV